MTYTIGSLFAGIGGFDLGFERAGFKTSWQVEIDPYCQKVLAKNFPEAERFGDIRECGSHNLKTVDVICGGFPCQDISNAGKRAGIEGERSGLWSEMHRIIRELRPRFALIENVAALVNFGMDRVLCDLASIGRDAEWKIISAADMGAIHLRRRVWIISYPAGKQDGWLQQPRILSDLRAGCEMANAYNGEPQGRRIYAECGSERLTGASGVVRNSTSSRLPDWAGGEVGQPSPLTEFERPSGEDVSDTEHDGPCGAIGDASKSGSDGEKNGIPKRNVQREVERDFRGVAHGVSKRVDRLRGLGNAVVPQIPEMIARRIYEALEVA